jgi:GH24 family phage-related lysozyme (muramidase)
MITESSLLPRLFLLIAVVVFFAGFSSVKVNTADAKITSKTVKYNAYWEGGPFLVPYNDPAGHATIGYGHLLHLGPVTRKDRLRWGKITKKRALQLLRQDLRSSEQSIKERVKVRLTDPMWTALISYTFNLGPGYLDYVDGSKTPRTYVAAQLNKGNYLTAARQMRIYNGAYIGNKRVVLAGLKRRRNSEFRLMVKGIKQLNRR